MPLPRAMLQLYAINVQLMVNEGAMFALLPLQARDVGASGTELALILITFTAVTLLSAPLWGWVSDRFGRRMPLQAALVLNAAGMIVFAVAGSTETMAVARVLGGMATAAGISTRAYAADISTIAQRARHLTFIDSAWAVGLSVGPLSAGLLARSDWISPGVLLGSLSLITLLFVGMRLPPAPLPAAAPQTPVARSEITRRVRWTIGALLCVSCGVGCYRQVFVLHVAERFAFGRFEVGIVFAALGVVLVFTQIVVVPRVESRTGSARALLGSLTLFTIGMLLMPIAASVGTMVAGLTLQGIGGLVSVSLTGVTVSRATSAYSQGRALGLVQSVSALGYMSGYFGAGLVYDEVGRTMPFYVGAIVGSFALLLAFIAALGTVSSKSHRPQRPPDTSPHE